MWRLSASYPNVPQIIGLNKINENINYRFKQDQWKHKLSKKAIKTNKRRDLKEKTSKNENMKKSKLSLIKWQKRIILDDDQLSKDKELYDFLMIQHMSEYILKNIEFFKKYSKFIEELVVEITNIPRGDWKYIISSKQCNNWIYIPVQHSKWPFKTVC